MIAIFLSKDYTEDAVRYLVYSEVSFLWFNIDPRSDVPIYQQLVDGIKGAARGIVAPGDKLPSVRELAGRIAINPNTIAKAYREMEREGVIETLRGH